MAASSTLGNTFIPGSTASGRSYAKAVELCANQTAWLEVSVFDECTKVPQSLAGKRIANGEDPTLVVGMQPSARFVLQFELFTSESTRTVTNFLSLCEGVSQTRLRATYEHEAVQVTYLGTCFHKIIPGFCVEGGDLTKLVVGGANHFSSFGGQFEDENMRRTFNQKGLLGMSNNGPDSNGSRFFITTSDAHAKALDGRHCQFGRVVSGLDELIKFVAARGNHLGVPSCYAVVTGCGAGEPK
jgi:peptidylprolyl isomerase